MYLLTTRALLTACAVGALPFSTVAQHWNVPRKTPHEWPTAPVDMRVPDKFAGYHLVLQEQATEVQNGIYRHRERGYDPMARYLLRRRYHVNTERGAASLRAETVSAGSSFNEVSIFHARLIRTDGTSVDETGRGARMQRIDLGDHQWGETTVSFADLVIAPGEELEFVIEQTGPGILSLRESTVQGAWPIVHASILVRTTPDLPPMIETFNGFPEPEVDPVGKADTQRWRFEMLDPLPRDPLALVKNCAPFFTMSYWPLTGVSMSAFDRRYPRDLIVGRRNVHAFTNYVNAVKSRHGYRDVVGPIAEVMRFLHDSVQVLEEVDIERSIGQCFAARAISRAKLFSLYRAMLNILEVQMIICRARSRYQGRFGDANDAWSFQEFLAFQDQERKTLHFIYPNTTHQRFLLDELPSELNGAVVEALPYKSSGINGEPFTVTLPLQTSSTTFKQERVMLELADDGSVQRSLLRGSIGGFLPSALDADTTGEGHAQRLNAWIQRHFALTDLIRPELLDTSTLLPRTRRYESAGYSGQPGRLASGDTAGYHFVPAPFVHWPSILDPPTDSLACPKLLPFTFHRRTDLVLHAARPIRPDVPLSSLDARVSNTFGEFSATVEQPDPRTVILHFDLAVFNVVVDGTTGPWVVELQSAIDERLRTPLPFRY